MNVIIIYFLIGLFISLFLYIGNKDNPKPTRKNFYLEIIFLYPAVILLLILELLQESSKSAESNKKL